MWVGSEAHEKKGYMSRKGHATCTQQYCWGTQQTVNERNCPSAMPLSGRTYFQKNFGRRHSGKLPEEPSSRRTPEYVPEGRVPEVFPEEGSSGIPPPSFGRRFFQK